MVREIDSRSILDINIPGDDFQVLKAYPDERLLSQTAGGDEQAFCELYSRYSKHLYNYLLRLVHEPTVAEDLLQEVFIAVWIGAGRYRGQATVKTWLFRITHHQAVSWLRKARVSESYDDLGVISSDKNPEDQAADIQLADQIRMTLDKLSTKHRSVLELAFIHELSYSEIAIIVGCPIGTVKSRMNQALRLVEGYFRGTVS